MRGRSDPEVSLETERRVPMSQTAHGARAVPGLVYAYQVAARCSVARAGMSDGRPSASRAVLEADGCACAQGGTMTPARGSCRRLPPRSVLVDGAVADSLELGSIEHPTRRRSRTCRSRVDRSSRQRKRDARSPGRHVKDNCRDERIQVGDRAPRRCHRPGRLWKEHARGRGRSEDGLADHPPRPLLLEAQLGCIF